MKKIIFWSGILLMSIYLLSLFYIGLHVDKNTAKPSDVIVILGARSLHNNALNPCLDERVKAGVALYKKGYAPKVLMTGGSDTFAGKSQAEIMGDLAVTYGMPKQAILFENDAKNTYENILFSKQNIATQSGESMIIVSDPYHLPRASLIASSLDIPHTVYPAVESPCWSKYKFLGFDFFRDGAALISYILTAKITILP